MRKLLVGRVLIAVLLSAGIPALTACGGGSEEAGRVEPEAWANDVCTAVREFQAFSDASADEAREEFLARPPVERMKMVLVTSLMEVLEETDALLRKIDAAGTPAGEQGEEVRREFRAVVDRFRPLVADLVAQAQNLPTRDLSQFVSKLEEIAVSAERDFLEFGDDAAKTFSRLRGVLEIGEIPEACRGD